MVYSHLLITSNPATVTNIITFISEVYRKEGLTALWKGLGPNLVGVIPARSIYFGVYGKVKHTLAERNGREQPWIHMASAATAGATSATITSPIWWVQLSRAVFFGVSRTEHLTFPSPSSFKGL